MGGTGGLCAPLGAEQLESALAGALGGRNPRGSPASTPAPRPGAFENLQSVGHATQRDAMEAGRLLGRVPYELEMGRRSGGLGRELRD